MSVIVLLAVVAFVTLMIVKPRLGTDPTVAQRELIDNMDYSPRPYQPDASPSPHANY